MTHITPPSLVPVGNAYQRISLANSTAVAVNSTIRKCEVLLISVEAGSARFRMDSTAPTKSTGVLIPAGLSPWTMEAYNGTSNLKFNRGTTAATVIVSIGGYTRSGNRSGSGR